MVFSCWPDSTRSVGQAAELWVTVLASRLVTEVVRCTASEFLSLDSQENIMQPKYSVGSRRAEAGTVRVSPYSGENGSHMMQSPLEASSPVELSRLVALASSFHLLSCRAAYLQSPFFTSQAFGKSHHDSWGKSCYSQPFPGISV